MLNLLVDSIVNARILLLVNYRPEYRHEWGSRSHYTQLRLDPLGTRERRRNAFGHAGQTRRSLFRSSG